VHEKAGIGKSVVMRDTVDCCVHLKGSTDRHTDEQRVCMQTMGAY